MSSVSKEIKYFSKSNLKSKCRAGYHLGRSVSLLSLIGSAVHFLISSHLLGTRINKKNFDYVVDMFGIPDIVYNDLKNLFFQWKIDIGDYILRYYKIISVESNDSKKLKYGKSITKVDLDDKYGIQGMFDLVCVDSNGRYHVIDWKSGMIPDDPEFENICNGTLAYLNYDLDYVESIIYSIPTGIKEKFTINKNNIANCIKIIYERIEKVVQLDSKSEYERTPNTFCFYCGIKSSCKQYLEMLKGIPVFESTTDLKKIIIEIERLKTIAKAVINEKKSLESICKELLSNNNKVKIGNYNYLLKDRILYEYKTVDIYNTLMELGCKEDDLNKILKISKGDLDDLLKKIKTNEGKKIFKTARDVVYSMRKESSRNQVISKKLII